jgi:hypothetical protein
MNRINAPDYMVQRGTCLNLECGDLSPLWPKRPSAVFGSESVNARKNQSAERSAHPKSGHRRSERLVVSKKRANYLTLASFAPILIGVAGFLNLSLPERRR